MDTRGIAVISSQQRSRFQQNSIVYTSAVLLKWYTVGFHTKGEEDGEGETSRILRATTVTVIERCNRIDRNE